MAIEARGDHVVNADQNGHAPADPPDAAIVAEAIAILRRLDRGSPGLQLELDRLEARMDLRRRS